MHALWVKKGCDMTARHLLEQKGRKVWTIGPDDTVFNALARMAENDVGSLIVMDGEKLVGIVTERHYSRNIILKGKTSPTTLVREIMERDVVHVRPEQSVELCMAMMTEKRVRHLPVLEGQKVVGIISIGDLLKSIISKQKFVIDELEHYIHG
jgi:CBS domain-containing protein